MLEHLNNIRKGMQSSPVLHNCSKVHADTTKSVTMNIPAHLSLSKGEDGEEELLSLEAQLILKYKMLVTLDLNSNV